MFPEAFEEFRRVIPPEERSDMIAAYYRRVTTEARPMNRLVGTAMLGTLAAIATQLARGDAPGWVGWASLVLAGAPIVLAAVHTFPAAVRLGAGAGEERLRIDTARAICRDQRSPVRFTPVRVEPLGFSIASLMPANDTSPLA